MATMNNTFNVINTLALRKNGARDALSLSDHHQSLPHGNNVHEPDQVRQMFATQGGLK